MNADAEYVERCRSIAKLMGFYGLLEDEPARLRTLLSEMPAIFPDASPADIEAAFEKHVTAENIIDRFERGFFELAVGRTSLDDLEHFFLGSRGRALSERIAQGIRLDGMEQRLHDGAERLSTLRESDPDLAGMTSDFSEANILINRAASQWAGDQEFLMAAVYNAMSSSGGAAAIAFSPEAVMEHGRTKKEISAALGAEILSDATDRSIASYLAFAVSETGWRFFWLARGAMDENHPIEDMAAELMALPGQK